MAPPPATPTPHRFLVPKRSQPRTETPKAFQSGGQQFQATPRFSLHSTPRGPSGGNGGPSLHPSSSITTPAPARLGAGTFLRPTPRNTDPINDVVSSSPPFFEGRDGSRRDPIEVFDVDTDTDAVPESSPVREGTSNGDESSEGESGLRHPSPKRRRISISSGFASSQQEYESTEDAVMRDGGPSIQSSLPSFTHAHGESPELSLTPFDPRPPVSAQQPTFQRAPRFKPVEVPEGSRRGDPLPDAFSPHRKGAKYVPGGLAASVRGWFVDVWAGASTAAAARRDGEWIARVVVEEVRAAPGLTLVTGRHVVADRDAGDGNGDPPAEGGDAQARGVRVVLSGSPRIAGLERRQEVRPGVVVGVGRPTWEVSVPGQGRWGVVCEWAILH
ncbi:hypothetical protein F4804DRAFT_306320 [Jackrogersella minutella]|nr:hypothetical protein F4804DRAFT_306320 [Jackrogersella minutella]